MKLSACCTSTADTIVYYLFPLVPFHHRFLTLFLSYTTINALKRLFVHNWIIYAVFNIYIFILGLLSMYVVFKMFIFKLIIKSLPVYQLCFYRGLIFNVYIYEYKNNFAAFVFLLIFLLTRYYI